MEYNVKITATGEAADIISALEQAIENIEIKEDMDALQEGIYEWYSGVIMAEVTKLHW